MIIVANDNDNDDDAIGERGLLLAIIEANISEWFVAANATTSELADKILEVVEVFVQQGIWPTKTA